VIADLHAHYPMRVVGDVTPYSAVKQMRRVRGRRGLDNKARALILKIASRLLSDPDWWSGYRITVPYLRAGGVGLVLSALYRPFEEMDLSKHYEAPPASDYFAKLVEDLEAVEHEVGHYDRNLIRVVHDLAELDACIGDGATALVHCVEGGFHLGDRSDEIERNVAALAGRGVAYITVAHLFFRQVATNAPAIPFIPDWLYNKVFPQAEGTGLTERGIAAVRAMVANRVLVDISHMRPDAVQETLDLLDELDPHGDVPVISSHAGYRFGPQTYMLDETMIARVKRRDGVIGLILAQHQINDGLRKKQTKTLAESLEVLCRHIDKIAELTGSHRHVALGTDLDGFIKPTTGGVETMADLKDLERELRNRYPQDADLLLWENSLRVLRKAWTPSP
jgi:microsomal dipeptidase-like Zn-dependent dipeptidase